MAAKNSPDALCEAMIEDFLELNPSYPVALVDIEDERKPQAIQRALKKEIERRGLKDKLKVAFRTHPDFPEEKDGVVILYWAK